MNETQIERINRIYFGVLPSGNVRDCDITCDYLLDDMQNLVEALIQHIIVAKIVIDREKYRKQEISTVKEDGSVETINGDFDPFGAHLLFSVLETFDYGLVVRLRKIVCAEFYGRKANADSLNGKNGSRTGGDFLIDLKKISFDDVCDYIKRGRQSFNLDKDGEAVRKKLDALKVKAKKLTDINYYDKLVRRNEGLALHKNRCSVKRKLVRRENEDDGRIGVGNFYAESFYVEPGKVARCMNDFAEVVDLYRDLLRGGGFYSIPLYSKGRLLSNYVWNSYRSVQGYSKNDSIPIETIEFVRKSLAITLKLLMWGGL